MKSSPKPWKVLLIDDEKDIREVTRLVLEDMACVVDTADNGSDGFLLCDTFSPHILLTDIRMPGMDGIELLEKVKAAYPDLEVIVMTAFAEIDLAIGALRLDASDFITKPIHSDALEIALKRAQQRYLTRQKLDEYTHFLEEGWSDATKELLGVFSYQKRLIESSMDGILGCNANDRVVTYNHSLEKMLGYPHGRVIHQMNINALFAPGQFEVFMEKLKSDRYGGLDRLSLFETELMTDKGRNVPVQVSAIAFENDANDAGIVCFFRDLRVIHQLEQEMADQAKVMHRDKMMALGKLAASVVHEINNPLSGLLNYSKLMNRILGKGTISSAQQEKFAGYSEIMEQEIMRLSHIVSSLLIFSRKSSPLKASIDLFDILNRCIILSKHRLKLQNIKLETALQTDLPKIHGDANQLHQCFINLIFNAMDAMPHGGVLLIKTSLNSSHSKLEIKFTDTGSGISSADLPYVFEPFFTTKAEGYGVGLGLSTSYGIIVRHNGSISVESSMGKGTTFTIGFPCLSGSGEKSFIPN